MSTPHRSNIAHSIHERCCPPNISSVTRDHDDSCELPEREAGRLNILPVTVEPDHFSTQAFPHKGLTAPSLAMARDGRTPGSQSDRVTESTAECPVCALRQRALFRIPFAAVCVDRSVAV